MVTKFKNILWSVYSLLIHGMDYATLLHNYGKVRNTSTIQKILIVRLDVIGDFVLWLDAAKEIRRLYPSDRYRITLLGNRLWTLLAEGLPWFDEVVPLEREKFKFHPAYRHKVLRAVRKTGFDVAVQPTFSREFLYGDSVVRFSGARERIGSRGDCSNQVPFLKRISDRWYTRLIPASKEPLMELERNAEFLRGLGQIEFRAGLPDLPVPRTVFPALMEMEARGYYVLFPGATVTLRQWPAEYYAEIAKRIFREVGWSGVICGGGGDQEFGEHLCRLAGVPLLNLAGKTSLPDLVSVIAKSRLLIGNETGAIHIAAAVSTPSVCILGGGHHGRFVPYRTEVESGRPLPVAVVHRMECFQCGWNCIYRPKPGEVAPCVRDIPLTAVWEVVQRSIQGLRGKKE